MAISCRQKLLVDDTAEASMSDPWREFRLAHHSSALPVPGPRSSGKMKSCSSNSFTCVLCPQSLEPLPPSGPEFGGLGEEAEFIGVEPEAKQEILENKDVSIVGPNSGTPLGRHPTFLFEMSILGRN